MTKTVDMTPTWHGILPAIILILDSGTTEARGTALMELDRMARLADKYVALQKKGLTSEVE
ncbi:hypothetical protein EBT25_07990 [bacterium]|nr:hypothetical protein [bacterium]